MITLGETLIRFKINNKVVVRHIEVSNDLLDENS